MKPPKPFFLAFALVLAGCAADALTLTPETTEVVVAPEAPDTVRFAVEELTNALSRVFASPVAVVEAVDARVLDLVAVREPLPRSCGVGCLAVEKT